MSPAEPPDQQHYSHHAFLERALTSAGEWTRYADPKGLGVLVLLGLGTADLLNRAGQLVHPTGGQWPAIATACFVIATLAAACAVVFVTQTLFPRLSLSGLLPSDRRAHGKPQSHFYFAEVAKHSDQQAYFDSVRSQDLDALLRDVAGQVYEISVVASCKHRAARRAYVAAVLFLAAWVAARICLALA